MPILSIRLDVARTSENDELVHEFVQRYCPEKYLIAAEHGKVTGKEHYQGIMYTEKTQQAVRERLLKIFPVVGAQYSLGVVKKEAEYLSYLTKEDVLFIEGIDDTAIKEWVPKEVLVSDRKMAEKTAKVKAKTFTQQMIEDYGHTKLSPEGLYKWVMEYYRTKAKIFDKFVIDKAAFILLASTDESNWRMLKRDWATDFSSKNNLSDRSICQSESSRGVKLPEGLVVNDPHVDSEVARVNAAWVSQWS